MFFENIIFNHQRVFHKELSTQQCLLAIPKKYIKSPLIGVKQNLALMDVAYLLLELFMIIHQIKNNNERNNWSYSELLGIVSGVPQGLDFGQVLFNTYLADIFFIMDDIDLANHADGNTPYVTTNDIDEVAAFGVAATQRCS